MSQVQYMPPPRFEITRVLSRTAGAISRNAVLFVGLALVLGGLPHLIVALARQGLSPPDPTHLSFVSQDWGSTFLATIVAGLSGILLQAALINATVADLNNRHASLGDCFATALRHLLPLIVLGIVSGILTALGFLLLIVPGVILALALCVAVPARVMENVDVFAALSRSRELTRGHRGALLLLFVLYFIVVIILGAVIAAAGKVGELQTSGDATMIALRLMLAAALQAIGSMVGAAGIAATYFELRSIKEGVSIEDLAATFA